MRSILLLPFITLLLATGAQAGTLVSSKTLTVASADSHTEVSNLNVKVSVHCFHYKKNAINAKSVDCGSSSLDLRTNSLGQVHIPAIHQFENSYGMNADNYSISISFSNQSENLFSLSAKGGTQIQNLNKFNQVLNVMKIEGTEIEITAGGQKLFGSALSQVDRASFLIFARQVPGPDHFNRPLLINSFDSLSLGYENFKFNTDPLQLKDVRTVTFPDSYIVYTGPRPNIDLRAAYMNLNGAVHQTVFSSHLVLPLTADVLSQIRSLDLKPVQQ